MNQRWFSCESGRRYGQAPLCKGHKISEPEKTCQPKEGSCFAIMRLPKKAFPKCSVQDIKPSDHLSCCSNSHPTQNPNRPKKKTQRTEERPLFPCGKLMTWKSNAQMR
ncbi:hypothetical protein EVAR_72926_1 [Eumeta japonica]|uniref:Uncharacterized protein n=1 Tax=Eumeta variegata TaxID=151549 RepID=A0A4C1T8V2_EUMVA|nr:hypothetical protein EVAR_72926_1 [Eumeta japonica]